MPRNKDLNQKIKEERREQILSSALQLFTQRGLAATKITDIAAAANISQGLMYHYFKSKEEVYIELIRIAFDRLHEACRWLIRQTLAPEEKIRLALREILAGLEQNEDHSRYHLLIAQATSLEVIPEEAKNIIKQENTFPYEAIAAIIAEGQKQGSIKLHDPKELALVFWTSINGLAIYKAVHGPRFKAPAVNILGSMFFQE